MVVNQNIDIGDRNGGGGGCSHESGRIISLQVTCVCPMLCFFTALLVVVDAAAAVAVAAAFAAWPMS